MTGVQIIPITWSFKVKRFTDGRHRKLKAILCTRGNIQVGGVDYLEKYPPVVSWTKSRPMPSMRINQGWDTRQVDFYNAFVHATLVENVNLALPSYFYSDTGEDRANMAINLNKSICGLVQAPLY